MIGPVPRRRLLCASTYWGLALLLPALAACSSGPTPAAGTDGPVRFDYGPDAGQFGELTLPAGDGPVPVVMVVHGGFWRSSFGLELGRPLAVDLAGAGVAAWNVEYRRVGSGGGWTATFDDVAAALDRLAGLDPRLDLDRVVAVGHSAGGHLAAWLAARPGLPAGAPGAVGAGGGRTVRLRGAVSQAGVLDLVDAVEQGVGGSAVTDLIGGTPARFPDRYALASPVARVPIGVPVVSVHGTDDVNVPIRQSERFAAASGDELVTLPGVEHFAVIDPGTEAWRICREAAIRLAG
jgi:acetyl esterase/lipase